MTNRDKIDVSDVIVEFITEKDVKDYFQKPHNVADGLIRLDLMAEDLAELERLTAQVEYITE